MNQELPLAPETAVALMLNGSKVADLMCTTHNLDDMAAGYLFTRGILSDPLSVISIEANGINGALSVTAPMVLVHEGMEAGKAFTSGYCWSVGMDDAAIQTRMRLPLGLSMSLGELKDWAKAMFEAAVLYRLTGGMHCAALAIGSAKPGGHAAGLFMGDMNTSMPKGAMYFVVREDIGRHNALDKVLGRAFVDMVDFGSSCILTSGRIAADMVAKAAVARVPIIVSRSIPSTAAFEIASRIGITMVGRIGDERPILYTNPERIRL